MEPVTDLRATNLGGVWVGLDQLASSGTNFVGAALAAGLLSAGDFGAWAIAFTIYVLAMSTTRTWCGDILLLVVPADPDRVRAHISGAGALAAAAGAAIGLLVALASFVPDGSTGEALRGLAICLPGLLVQDALRFGLIAGGSARGAFLNDVLWLAFLGLGLMVLRRADYDSVFLAMALWGLPTYVCVVLALRQTRARPTRRAAISWIRTASRLASRISAEHAVYTLSSMLFLFALLSTTRDTELIGALKAAQVLLGPATVVFAASTTLLIPIMVQQFLRGTDLRSFGWAQSTVNVVALGACFGAVLLIPQSVGTRLFGASWEPAQAQLAPVAVFLLAAALSTGAITTLRAQGRVSRSLRIRTAIATIVVATTVLAATLGSAESAVAAFAGVSLCGPVLLWCGAWQTSSQVIVEHTFSGIPPGPTTG